MAHRPGQGLGGKSTEPDRRVRSLHRLRLDGKAIDVAEPAVERHLGFVRPGRLHQLQALGEIADERVLVHAEGGELAGPAARRDADVQPAVAEPVDGRDGRGQLQRLMQRRHQDGDAQAQPLGAGGAIREQLQRRQQRCRPDGLLEHPTALEAKLLGTREIRAQPGGIEAVGIELGDSDGKPHPITVRRPIGRLANMFGFLPSLPGVDDVRDLVNRVDTARHHGIPSGCVLEFDLRSVPPETTGFDPLTIVTGGGRAMALRDAVAAIHRAAEDPRVAGLIARVQLAASPVGAVQELREAIAAFSAVKPSLAWAETYPGTLSYYLASAFGEVWMQPSGSVGLIGFASSATFLRDALDKAGIEAQFTARGEYKSAANLFTQAGFTEAHREAVTRMLESLQDQVWQAVAESRNIDAGALDALADRAPLLRDDAVESGLVDRIGFRDEAYARIAKLVGVERCFR